MGKLSLMEPGHCPEPWSWYLSLAMVQLLSRRAASPHPHGCWHSARGLSMQPLLTKGGKWAWCFKPNFTKKLQINRGRFWISWKSSFRESHPVCTSQGFWRQGFSSQPWAGLHGGIGSPRAAEEERVPGCSQRWVRLSSSVLCVSSWLAQPLCFQVLASPSVSVCVSLHLPVCPWLSCCVSTCLCVTVWLWNVSLS